MHKPSFKAPIKALLIAIAASASSFFTTSAIAQSSQPFTEPNFTELDSTELDFTEQTLTNSISDVLPTLSESGLPSALPSQQIFIPTIGSEGLTSPNIDIYNANAGVQVILIDPIEQGYLNSWEQTITPQLSNVNIRSAVQAPITQIQIRAGRPVVERLGRFSTNSIFFDNASGNTSTYTVPAGTVSNFPTRNSRSRIREFSDLPDGNYRLLLSSSGIGDGGFVREGRLFTFRKLGETVTGNFDYIGSGESACVTGTLQGNTVFGEAISNSAGVRVLDRTYLGSGLSLQMSDRDSSAVLDLNGFSFVNVGTVAPPTACR